MSRPDDMIMVTFTREQLELIREVFSGDAAEACGLAEMQMTGEGEARMGFSIVDVAAKALKDTE